MCSKGGFFFKAYPPLASVSPKDVLLRDLTETRWTMALESGGPRAPYGLVTNE